MPEANKRSSPQTPQSWLTASRLRALAIAGLVVLLGLGAWSFIQHQRGDSLPPELAPRVSLEPPSSTPVSSPSPAPAAEENVQQTLMAAADALTKSENEKRPSLVSIALRSFLAGIARGDDEITPQKLVLPPQVRTLRLLFPAPSDRFRQYEASLLRTADSKPLRKFAKLAVGKQQQLRLQVSTTLLPSGNYTLKLTGVGENALTESVGEYRFTIARRR